MPSQGSPKKSFVAGILHDDLPTHAAVTLATLFAELQLPVANFGQLPVGLPYDAKLTPVKVPALQEKLATLPSWTVWHVEPSTTGGLM